MWISILFIWLIFGFAALLGYASVSIKYDDKGKREAMQQAKEQKEDG